VKDRLAARPETRSAVADWHADLLIELKCLPWELPAHIQQDQIVAPGSPENARPLQAVGGIHLDAVTAENIRPRVARRLFFVDEQNLFAVEG